MKRFAFVAVLGACGPQSCESRCIEAGGTVVRGATECRTVDVVCWMDVAGMPMYYVCGEEEHCHTPWWCELPAEAP